MNQILTLLSNPRDFFSELQDERSLLVPAIIVIAIAIMGGISAYFITSVTVSAMPPEISQYTGFACIIAVIAGAIGSFFWWLILAGVFHAIARYQEGKAGFRQTLAVTGYGFAPQIIGSVISLIFIYLFTSSTSIPKISDLARYEEEIAAVMDSPYLMAIKILGVIFMLWSANIWIFGIESLHGFGRKKAIITVLIPVVIFIIITLAL